MKTISIQKIEFNEFQNKAICHGTLMSKNFSYKSAISLSFTGLNALLNYIGNQYDELDLYQFLESETTEGGTFYTFNFQALNMPEIPVEYLKNNESAQLRICA
ncbi:MAG: hypothetical protein EBS09_02085 [Flavobacteriia bacterium]|nr:hypothetical protein [Flavobacteriia bacterium]